MDSVLRDQCHLDPGRLIVAAVSGGPDSLCMMDLLHQGGFPVIVAHLNHKLREGADLEADNVEKMAGRLGLPSALESADVRTFAEENKLSIEDAARTLRYRFLFGLARRLGAQAIAVGHTADDQVETVLMHFLRGAGLNGLKGMTHRTLLPIFDAEIPIVRPLLDVWREQTVVYCAEQGFRPHYDPSNESLKFLRNRVRHVLIPALETYNQKFREAVWRTTQSLSADHAILIDSVNAAWERAVVRESTGLVIFDANMLAEFSPGLKRYLFRRAMERIDPAIDVTYAALERIIAFLSSSPRAKPLLLNGGIRILCEAGQIFVTGRAATLPSERWPQLPMDMDAILLAPPCRMDLTGGWCLTCERGNIAALAREQMQENEDPYQVWLDADVLQGELSLRIRREGDRFEPLGMDGHSQKVSDFFTNVKLPARARNRWPLLSAGGTIAWIPGYQPAHAFRLTKTSRRILYFALHPPEKNEEEPQTRLLR